MYDNTFYESPGGGLVQIAVQVHKSKSSEKIAKRPQTPKPKSAQTASIDSPAAAGRVQKPEFEVVDGSIYSSEYHKCSLCDNVHKCTVRTEPDSLSRTFTVDSDDDAVPEFSGTFTDALRDKSFMAELSASRQGNALESEQRMDALSPYPAVPLKQSTPIDGGTTASQQPRKPRHSVSANYDSSHYGADDEEASDAYMDDEFDTIERYMEDSFRAMDEKFEQNDALNTDAFQAMFADRNPEVSRNVFTVLSCLKRYFLLNSWMTYSTPRSRINSNRK